MTLSALTSTRRQDIIDGSAVPDRDDLEWLYAARRVPAGQRRDRAAAADERRPRPPDRCWARHRRTDAGGDHAAASRASARLGLGVATGPAGQRRHRLEIGPEVGERETDGADGGRVGERHGHVEVRAVAGRSPVGQGIVAGVRRAASTSGESSSESSAATTTSAPSSGATSRSADGRWGSAGSSPTHSSACRRLAAARSAEQDLGPRVVCGARPAPERLEQAHRQPGVPAEAAPALLDRLGGHGHGRAARCRRRWCRGSVSPTER